MKLFAWAYLFPMGIYWMMFVFFNFEAIKTEDFFEKTAFSFVKHGIMIFAGLHFYLWYKWKDGSGSKKPTSVSKSAEL